MNERIDRRRFLGTSLRAAGGAAFAGAFGGTLLGACSSASSSSVHGGGSPFGGSLNLGTWSEVDSLSPPAAEWDATGYLYGNALFDSLTQIGADGKPHPYLAESVTANHDYTSWLIKVRPGVIFHDGTACDGAAVRESLEAMVSGIITGFVLQPVKRISLADEMTVRVDLDQPWVPFPSYLATQIGYVAAPASLRAPGQGGNHPIGSGPFVFGEWVPNSHLNVTRNPHYWQKPYPYLDSITFKPIPEPGVRDLALKSGSIDLEHTNYPGSVAGFLHDSSYMVTEGVAPPGSEPAIDFIMLNCSTPPLDDLDIRRALVMAVDKSLLEATYGANLMELVTGPFPPGNTYYAPTDYPAYDPSTAKSLVSAYTASHGSPPSVRLSTIVGPEYESVVTVLQQQWGAAGVDVSTNQIAQSAFISDAIFGTYQAATFELFWANDPDQNYVWWSSATVGAAGGPSLNLTRNEDPLIQRALEQGRQNPDPEARVDAYRTVAARLAADLPYIWLGKALWAAIGLPNIVGLTGQVLPDGSTSAGFNDGVFLLHQIRLNGG